VPAGSALRRTGARQGDKIFISGYIGDAALAITGRDGALDLSDQDLSYVNNALNKPVPRVGLGQKLQGLASSAIDVSDGLTADLKHILDASKCGATIDLRKLPLSPVYLKFLDQVGGPSLALGFGDDYELCFTAPENKVDTILTSGKKLGCPITVIGEIDAEPGIRFLHSEGLDITITDNPGYDHFPDDLSRLKK
jgi:thiamine-monophosphate kinase